MPDVLTIGNALVDVLDHEDDAFLAAHDLVKGSMHLVDADRSAELYAAMGPGIEMSGGCAANTAAGVVSLGGSAGFVGKVRDDQLGTVYRHDLASVGVEGHVHVTPADDPTPTGSCLVVVTPDGDGGTTIGLAPSRGHFLEIVLGKIEYIVSQLLPPSVIDVLQDAVHRLADLFANSPPWQHAHDSATGAAPSQYHPPFTAP